MKGETYGIEVSTDIRPSSWCRFSAAWSLLEMDMHLKKTQAMDSTAYIAPMIQTHIRTNENYKIVQPLKNRQNNSSFIYRLRIIA
jgi:hypothetical protein